MLNYKQVEFGMRLKDTVTGFKGYVVAKAEHCTGCNQIALQPKGKSNDSCPESRWFDIERLVATKGKPIIIVSSPSGGPRGADEAPLR